MDGLECDRHEPERLGERPALWRGLLAGAAGGIAGSSAMTQFHVALYGRGVTGAREPQSHRPVDVDDDAATKTADEIAVAATGRRLGETRKRIGGPLVHYAFGAAVGALYGAAAVRVPALRRGQGVGFGVLVWGVADEALLPALGLARGPRAYPIAVHLEMLAAHVVFGVVTHRAFAALLGTSAGAGDRAPAAVPGLRESGAATVHTEEFMATDFARTDAYSHAEGRVARSIEQQTAKMPSDVFLWMAVGAMATSFTLQMMGRQHVSLFVGQWAPSFLLFGIYNKLVKQLGSDRTENAV